LPSITKPLDGVTVTLIVCGAGDPGGGDGMEATFAHPPPHIAAPARSE
jgi:hypothetical protein